MIFEHLKPYTLIELNEAQVETHIVLDGEHYTFGDTHFHVDVDQAFNESEALGAIGVKSLLINTHALMSIFYENEVECRGIGLGIFQPKNKVVM